MCRTRLGPPRLRRDSGVAMLEFVLMLPFIFVVLLLVVDFGQGLLERQRTLVAVREVALRHARDVGEPGTGPKWNRTQSQVTADVLKPRALVPAYFLDRHDGCPGRHADPPDDSWRSQGAELVNRVLGTISASHYFEIEARGSPIAGRLLPQPTYAVCMALDGNPWTYDETGGPSQWLRKAFGALGRWVGSFL
jgi:hypothetical protein